MNKSGPPTRLAPSEYEAIEQAMMETERGRWFLSQFAEKNRRKDTQVVLEAISKLESTVSTTRSQPEAERIKMDLVEMSQAISRTRNEIANLKLPEHDGGNLLDATEELDSIVSTTERATNKILQAAEDIQETAWTIREDGSFEAPCARIDTDVTDIYTACSFQDITGQRTQKVVHILRYLEARINAMVSIWGLDQEVLTQVEECDDKSVPDNRPDAHLLNGPQLDENALKQDDIDGVMNEAPEKSDLKSIGKNQNQAEIDITAKFIAQTAHEVEALTIQAVEVAEELILAAESVAIELDDDDLASINTEQVNAIVPEDSSITLDEIEKANEADQALEDKENLSTTDAFKDIATSPELTFSTPDKHTENIAEDISNPETEVIQEEVISTEPSSVADESLTSTENIPEAILTADSHIEDSNHEEINSVHEELEEKIDENSAETVTNSEEYPILPDENKPLITDEIEGADTIISALAQELEAFKDEKIEETPEEDNREGSQEAHIPDDESISASSDEQEKEISSLNNLDKQEYSSLESLDIESDHNSSISDNEDNENEVISQEQASFVKHFSRIHQELQAAKPSGTDLTNDAEIVSTTADDSQKLPDTIEDENIASEKVTETEQESGYQASDWVGQNLYLLLEEEENAGKSDEKTMSSRLRELPPSAKTAAFE